MGCDGVIACGWGVTCIERYRDKTMSPSASHRADNDPVSTLSPQSCPHPYLTPQLYLHPLLIHVASKMIAAFKSIRFSVLHSVYVRPSSKNTTYQWVCDWNVEIIRSSDDRFGYTNDLLHQKHSTIVVDLFLMCIHILAVSPCSHYPIPQWNRTFCLHRSYHGFTAVIITVSLCGYHDGAPGKSFSGPPCTRAVICHKRSTELCVWSTGRINNSSSHCLRYVIRTNSKTTVDKICGAVQNNSRYVSRRLTPFWKVYYGMHGYFFKAITLLCVVSGFTSVYLPGQH